jgi:hypothetical protein
MAIEYSLEATAVLPEDKALDYFAGLLGADQRHTSTYAARSDLQIDTEVYSTEDDPEIRALIGDVEVYLSVTFREMKNIGAEASAEAERDMLRSVIQFLEDFPNAKGLFTYRGEEILVQRLGDEGIVFDERLQTPVYNRLGLLDEILAKYPIRQIDQVFL